MKLRDSALAFMLILSMSGCSNRIDDSHPRYASELHDNNKKNINLKEDSKKEKDDKKTLIFIIGSAIEVLVFAS